MNVEGDAAWLLRQAGFDIHDAPGGLALARRLGLEVRAMPLRGADAMLATVGARRVILIRPRLHPRRAHFLICHELAEHHLAAVGYTGPDVERVANALGAALLVPRAAYRSALATRGARWEQLALDFSATETAIALRHGEVTGDGLVVVSPTAARVRGAWVGPADEDELRRLARRPGPGLVAARLRDDRRRIVLTSR